MVLMDALAHGNPYTYLPGVLAVAILYRHRTRETQAEGQVGIF